MTKNPTAPPPDELGGANLMAVALDLLEAAERRQSSTHLRRALSTAYYAMFHCLARVSADRLIRSRGAARDAAAWLHVYRSLQHRHANRQCLDARALAAHPEVIQRFATYFAGLQEQRHQADTNPAAVFKTADVRRRIHTAAEEIRLFEGASETDQAAFAAWVLLVARRS